MEFFIRFAQIHESFRRPELEAIADLLGIELVWVEYSEDVSLLLRGRVVIWQLD